MLKGKDFNARTYALTPPKLLEVKHQTRTTIELGTIDQHVKVSGIRVLMTL